MASSKQAISGATANAVPEAAKPCHAHCRKSNEEANDSIAVTAVAAETMMMMIMILMTKQKNSEEESRQKLRASRTTKTKQTRQSDDPDAPYLQQTSGNLKLFSFLMCVKRRNTPAWANAATSLPLWFHVMECLERKPS